MAPPLPRHYDPPWAVKTGGPPLTVAELLSVVAARFLLWVWWATAARVFAWLQPGRHSFTRLGGLPRQQWIRLPPLVRSKGGEGRLWCFCRQVLFFKSNAPDPPPTTQLSKPKPEPPLVLCIGDSLTEGVVSADWVASLAAGLRGRAQVVNAGVSGATAPEIAGRVSSLLDAYSSRRIAVVLLLAGTNDMLATAAGDASQARYRWSAGLPRATFGRATALAGVATALDTLALRAPGAAVGVLTLPPIGEDVGSKINAAVRDANRGLRAVAASRPGVALLDAHAALSAALSVATGVAGKQAGKGWRARLRPPPPSGMRPAVTLAGLAARILARCKWDKVGRATGASILFDGCHMGETGAACVLVLTLPFCRRALRDRGGWAYDR